MPDNVLRLTYYGVRGSTPCCGDELQRYGGNTSCVVLQNDDEPPIIFDMGTGLRIYGGEVCRSAADTPYRATILLTHLHWDHVQGLPFFGPLHEPDTEISIFGPLHPGRANLGELFDGLMKPPYFPICPSELAGRVRFFDTDNEDFSIGAAKVMSRPVPHTGETNGYRVEWDGVSVAYVSDHQEPPGEPTKVAETVLQLCDGVDVLIHDAQYTPDEYQQRIDWGHCTVAYAVEVAKQAGVGTLVLFHHDPGHDDEHVDRLLAEARCLAAASAPDLRVAAAVEGTSFELSP